MNGYIYKIYSPDNKYFYYGLTTKNIYLRLVGHIRQYLYYKAGTITNRCASFDIFDKYGIDYIKIDLIEKLENTTPEKLLEREIYYIQNFECVNIRSKNTHENISKSENIRKRLVSKIININISNNLFLEYLNENKKNRDNEKYINLQNNIDALNLINQDNDILIKYQEIILDNQKINDHFNIIKIIKDDEYIKNEIINNDMYYNSTFHKIKIFREIEKNNNINPLDVEYFNNDKIHNNKIILSDELYKNIIYIFKSEKKKPQNIKKLGNLYRSMLINICSNKIFITKRFNKSYSYKLNIDYIKYHVELDSFMNPNYKNYHIYFNKILNIKLKDNISSIDNPNLPVTDYFIDDEKEESPLDFMSD